MMSNLNISSSAERPAGPSPTGSDAAVAESLPSGAPRPSLHEMHASAPDETDTAWVFNLQAVAVLLIVLGQTLEALYRSGALPLTEVALWLHDCLIPLQVPLLFFCLGYLYQRFRNVRSRRAWALNLKREALVLLAPFALFTFLILAANSIAHNEPALNLQHLVSALLLSPVEPLGYLYTAFLLIAITPTVKSRRNAYGLLLAAALVKVAIVGALSIPATVQATAALPYAVVSVAENWVWLAGGMALALLRGLPLMRSREKAWALGALWIAASVITFMAGWIGEASYAVLDAIGILWFASLFATIFRRGHQDRFFDTLTRFTMALFLMGGLFLILAQAALEALGFTGAGAPLLFALVYAVAAFGAPLAVQALLSRLGRADAVIYPARYLPPLADILRSPTATRRRRSSRLTLY